MALGITSRGIIGRFFERLQAEMANQWWSSLAMNFDSDQASETYKWLGMVPAVREWKGDLALKQLRENSLTIANKTWEASLKIDADDVRRDKTSQIMVRVDELARRVADHPGKLISQFIAAGTAATYGTAYDGQYFFDTDHAEGESGTQLNTLAAAQVAALNVGTATAPTPAEMADAILGVIAYMKAYKDDVGEPLNHDARSFLVLVPQSLYAAAYAVATKDAIVGTSGAIVPNVLSGGALSLRVALDARSTWTTNFAVFRTDGGLRPFIFQQELAPQIRALAEGSEYETLHNEHAYTCKAIHNVGYGMWQYAALATLS